GLLSEDPRATLGGPVLLVQVRGYAPSRLERVSASGLNGAAASMRGSLTAAQAGVNAAPARAAAPLASSHPPSALARPAVGGEDAPEQRDVRRVLRPAGALLEAQDVLERHARDPARGLGRVDERVDVLAHPPRPDLDAQVGQGDAQVLLAALRRAQPQRPLPGRPPDHDVDVAGARDEPVED